MLNRNLLLAEERLSGAKDDLDKFQKALAGTKKIAVEANEGLATLTEQIEEQIKTFGMSTAEVAIWQAQQKGANNVMLAGARAAAKRLQAIQDEDKLKESIKGVTDALNGRINATGATSNELEILQLKNEGATDAQIANLMALSRQADQMDKVRELTEQFTTPMERLKKQLFELDDLLVQGVIDNDLFNKAMKEVEKQFNEQEEAARAARMEITKFDAVLVGTAEAEMRIARQRDALGQRGEMAGAKGAIAQARGQRANELMREGALGNLAGGAAQALGMAQLDKVNAALQQVKGADWGGFGQQFNPFQQPKAQGAQDNPIMQLANFLRDANVAANQAADAQDKKRQHDEAMKVWQAMTTFLQQIAAQPGGVNLLPAGF